jgi:Protein of unknown function (DUF2844)
MRNHAWHFSALGCTLLLSAAASFAALDGDISSIQADQAHMQGSLRVTPASVYTLHEIHAPTGVKVREYLSPGGKVFGVAWDGPTMPDLKQLLGANFEAYAQAAKTQNQHGHGPLIVHEGNLIVEIGGRMRFHTGRAYLSDQLPAGVHAEDVR